MHDVETHGARIPALGLGTWQLSGSVARRAISPVATPIRNCRQCGSPSFQGRAAGNWPKACATTSAAHIAYSARPPRRCSSSTQKLR